MALRPERSGVSSREPDSSMAELNRRALSGVRGLRIAYLIESDGPGGAERMVANLASELQAAGCESLVVLPADGEGWLARQLEGTGVAVELFPKDRRVSGDFVRWLAATFQRYRISVAHSHEFFMASYGAWAAWRTGVKHVITMHGGRYYAERLRRRLALRAAFTLGGRVVAVSHALAQRLSADLWIRGSGILTIPNGVPYVRGRRPAVRDELALSATDRLLVAVGNLYAVKGHRYLIEAVGLLRDRQLQVHLAIAGRGELAGVLTAQARALGVGDRVHLLGLRSDVPDLLAAADIFVLPSLSEGLPLVLLEAMFAGCPVVACDVGDVRLALAGGQAGVLVEPGNSGALAAAIVRLVGNPAVARELGAHAAQRAAAEYGISQMLARYAATYVELLGRT